MRVSSTVFQQNVGRYQDAAMHEPVVITKRNRPHTVLISAILFDEDTLKAIAEATVPETHAGLNQLLKDWTP
jgi:prevent-host-death family protein